MNNELDDGTCPMCGLLECEHDDTDWLLSSEANRKAIEQSIEEYEVLSSGQLTDEEAAPFRPIAKAHNERVRRLKELREEFEAARDAFLNEVVPDPLEGDQSYQGIAHEARFHHFTYAFDGRWKRDHPESVWTQPAEQWAATPDGLSYYGEDELPLTLAARRYIIARDFGEFDPDKWELLWKLREGGAR